MLGAGPMCFLILYLMTRRDPSRHFWIVVLSTAELYGGCVLRPASAPSPLTASAHRWMTFAPDLLDGGKSLILDPTNILDFWIYLVFLNILCVLRLA